jgi:hypothetical protein
MRAFGKWIGSAALAFGIIGGAPAQAALISYQFFGTTVSSFGTMATSATTFTGSLTYDNAVVDSDPDPKRGLYLQSGVTIEFQAGSLSLSLALDRVLVRDDLFDGLDLDDLLFESINISPQISGTPLMRLTLAGTRALFDDDALPTSIPPLSLFNNLSFVAGDRDRLGFTIGGYQGALTSVQVISVPEPGTLALLLAPLVLLAARRRSS